MKTPSPKRLWFELSPFNKSNVGLQKNRGILASPSSCDWLYERPTNLTWRTFRTSFFLLKSEMNYPRWTLRFDFPFRDSPELLFPTRFCIRMICEISLSHYRSARSVAKYSQTNTIRKNPTNFVRLRSNNNNEVEKEVERKQKSGQKSKSQTKTWFGVCHDHCWQRGYLAKSAGKDATML